MSRWGRQPAAELLKQRGIKRGDAARAIGVKHSILNNTLAGHQTPSQQIRDGLAELLSVPVEELFTAEPLARRQGKRYRQGVWITRGEDARIVRRPSPPRTSDELFEEGRDSVALDDDPVRI